MSMAATIDCSPQLRWYVAVAMPNAVIEKPRDDKEDDELNARLPPQTVLERLEAAGDSVFWPKAHMSEKVYCRKARGHVTKPAWVPLWGRYFIVGTVRGPGAVRATRGVSCLLNNADGVPGEVSAELVAEQKRLYRNYKIARKLEEVPLKRGQVVRIMEGPFTGFAAQVQLVDMAKGLLKVMADVMGRETPISIPMGDVVAS